MLNRLRRGVALMTDRAFVGALALALTLQPALASQNSLVMPVTGTVSGVQLSNNITNALDSLLTHNLGPVAPTNQSSGTAEEGQCWINSAAGRPYKLECFSQSGWLSPLGLFDDANLIWTPPIGGGEAILTAAATVDLGSVPQAAVRVDGNTAISSFGSSAIVGTIHYVRFTGTPTLAYSSSLIIPGGNPLNLNPGDTLQAKYEGGGIWRIVNVALATGAPIALDPAGTVKMLAGFNLPTGYLWANGQAVSRATYANLFGTLCVSQSGNLTNGNGIISGLASTSNLGVGMPAGSASGHVGAAATVSSIDSGTQIHVSVSSNATGTFTVDVCPYGIGDGSTTYDVPDLRAAIPAGVDNMAGGGNSNRMSGCTNSGTLGILCGAQSVNIVQNQLPNVAPPLVGTAGTATTSVNLANNLNGSQAYATGAGTGAFGPYNTGDAAVSYGAITSNYTPAGTVAINGNVAQQALNVLNPIRLMNYAIKY